MNNFNFSLDQTQNRDSIHWGHFGVIFFAFALILGMSYMEKPDLFKFNQASNIAADQDVPHYYAYVPPATDDQPEVLGASTDPGPSIINDDGTVSPVDMGNVLAASTQDVQLSLDSINVNQVPDSNEAVIKYFTQAEAIEIKPVDTASFQAALTSNDQTQINQQAQQLTALRDSLQKLAVPVSLVKLQKLKIIQYSSAINLLENFSQADNNPTLVDQDLMNFIKAQQDLDQENIAVAQKYPKADPHASTYVDVTGQPIMHAPLIDNSQNLLNLPSGINNLGSNDAAQ
jgi:hypothetical protein